MDWGLVLASQGIPAKIDNHGGGGWFLLVSAHDGQKAFQAIRLYHTENRGWPWKDTASQGRIFHWGATVWCIVLIIVYWLSPVGSAAKDTGIMDSNAVASGQWWRVFTAITLHADLKHLAGNLAVGVILIGLTMGRFGFGNGLLVPFLAGAVGNLTSLLLNPKPFEGLGASGMVMGALGLLAARSWGRHESETRRGRMAAIGAGVMLFVLYGVVPGSDLAAHFGGFVGGLIFGSVLLLLPDRWIQSKVVNTTAALSLLTFIALAWWLALRHGNVFQK